MDLTHWMFLSSTMLIVYVDLLLFCGPTHVVVSAGSANSPGAFHAGFLYSVINISTASPGYEWNISQFNPILIRNHALYNF
jgi:hypothetical protein